MFENTNLLNIVCGFKETEFYGSTRIAVYILYKITNPNPNFTQGAILCLKFDQNCTTLLIIQRTQDALGKKCLSCQGPVVASL